MSPYSRHVLRTSEPSGFHLGDAEAFEWSPAASSVSMCRASAGALSSACLIFFGSHRCRQAFACCLAVGKTALMRFIVRFYLPFEWRGFFSLCVRLLVCTASDEQHSSSPPPASQAQSTPFPPGPKPNPESSAVSCAVRAGLAKCASCYDHAENMPAGLTRLARGAAERPGPTLLSSLSSCDLLSVSGETQQLLLGQHGLRGVQPRFATQIM